MDVFRMISVIALIICLSMLAKQFFALLAAGKPNDYSKPSGSVKKGVVYSFTGAMSPFEKESAYLHLPTYFAGIVFHIGAFLSLLLFPLVLFMQNILEYSFVLSGILSAILALGALSGAGILVKRLFNKNLKAISGVDDYVSNILTTSAQGVSAYLLLTGLGESIYFVFFILLLLWIPIGKTRHLIYFFFARYHLGAFYGRRGTWPQKQTGNE